MSTSRVPAEEQFRLITACRQSGLSDHQWCIEHNINPGTFYNWVSRLRKKACYDIPEPAGSADYAPTPKQDVVKVDIIPERPLEIAEPLSSPERPKDIGPSIEIRMDGLEIRVTNDADPLLLAKTIRMLRSLSC